jgi:hypothetical protein
MAQTGDLRSTASAEIGLPEDSRLPTVLTGQYFEALENFTRTFAFKPDDKLLFLVDRKLDPLVVEAISGLARARGVRSWLVMSETTQVLEVPEDVKPMVQKATIVVSTWFCSITDPFFNKLRAQGQRWVKITYFRNLELLKTAQARFPIDIVGELVRQTADLYPKGQAFDLVISDKRGSHLSIPFTAAMRENLLKSNRWRGKMAADEPGAYVHYLAAHGPNIYDRTSNGRDDSIVVPMNGTVYPEWSVGFARPFEEKIGVVFENDRITRVDGESEEALILRDMLVGGRLIELGCGFNPKAPRRTVYPAGSNSPGALHFGIDLAKPSDYIRKTMPEWEEPPVHMDLITFDSTVHAGSNVLIQDGFLTALRSPAAVAMAARYGDPVDLLENWPA